MTSEHMFFIAVSIFQVLFVLTHKKNPVQIPFFFFFLGGQHFFLRGFKNYVYIYVYNLPYPQQYCLKQRLLQTQDQLLTNPHLFNVLVYNLKK